MAYARINNAPPRMMPNGTMGSVSVGMPSDVSSSHMRKRSRAGTFGSDETGSQFSSAGRFAGASVPVAAYSKAAEADDEMHDPRNADKHSSEIDLRGFLNVLTLVVIGGALLVLFMGYPLLSHFLGKKDSTKGGFNLGGTNGTGQVGITPAIRSIVDTDTPEAAHKWKGYLGNYHIVFSDEFELPGRTFWPGDDPYWEAVDIWYGATGDYEWYSPEAVNTTDGALVITMEEKPTHNLNFRSGMLQSWNKFCYQGGYVEFSLQMPGTQRTSGYWPAAWTMANLGRPGYLASTDMWPYSYQACDTGALPNQTYVNGSGPHLAIHSTGEYQHPKGQLSTLPGMRTPSCTCPGEDHPGPDVTVGRSAPEIDVIEAQVQTRGGTKHVFASQSLQTAPFDDAYYWKNTSDVAEVVGEYTRFNDYVGGPLQESVSALSQCPDDGYTNAGQRYVTYGMEYSPDWKADGSGSVTWYVDGKRTWTVKGDAIGPNPDLDMGQRTVPTEPMTIVMNLGISPQFQTVNLQTGKDDLIFPAQMKVDYVRVYQLDGQEDRVSCDPPDHPTKKYIEDHLNLYMNPNLTKYADAGYPAVKNKILTGC
ncbi:BETA-GLUCAN SYNTHESIS-ASSOCIATED PROTEIN KRE6-RELATED [Ceraceosorus bombacis]|uniref:BETA-GLUCAN SYNTHESIS-ASSOCIATED PROTEIN KRE6-RELATED n=1 Tax=Ceraceosorus bombacis TaxID=401625 RepID=A0A0P1BLR2_9BASI|nr:BETA-GLUCAN SYNTHESIS-ASSOCIATED PROTEIN KRE6-RELATED [Ceraceosorus bombacis]